MIMVPPPPPPKAAKRKLDTWDYVGIGGLVILAVTSGLAIWYGVYGNPIGTYSSYVAYAMILLLTILAIFGKKLQPRTVIVPKKKAPVTKKSISTGAGTVQMASG